MSDTAAGCSAAHVSQQFVNARRRRMGDGRVRLRSAAMEQGDACPACANGILKHSGAVTIGAEKLRCEPAFAGERSCGSEWVRDGDGWEPVEPSP